MKSDLLKRMIDELEKKGRLAMERKYMQHGSTTIFEHSVHVAYTSLQMKRKLHIKADETSLVRGALLHDYFLYDWHIKGDRRSLHGFAHPQKALENAREDFALNAIEENIIARHMFPLTLLPPTCREAWIVCLTDKYCALGETLSIRLPGTTANS